MNSIKALQGNGKKNGMSSNKNSLSQAAKSMGISMEELGENAEEMWAMLTDMAENNPQEYQAYLEKQMQIAKKMETSHRKGFRPHRGFCVKTKATQGSRTVYINCCSFLGVEPPVDSSGKPVSGTANVNTSGMSIPIAIGKLRDIMMNSGAPAIVIDTVFNPWVIDQAKEFSSFHEQVVNLAIEFCEEELHGKLSRQYEVVAASYIGLEEDPTGGEPREVFFVVEEPSSTANEDHAKATPPFEEPTLKKDTISNPADLVNQMRQLDTKDVSPQVTLHMEKETPTKGKSLIQEVTDTKDLKKPIDQNPQAVKRGFLSSGGSIYGDQGSSEGAPRSLFEKSKIVDLNNMSNDEVREAMESYGQPQKAPIPHPPAAPTRVPNVTDLMKSIDIKTIDEFDKLSAQADADLAASNVAPDAAVRDTNDLNNFFGLLTQSLGMNNATTNNDQSSAAETCDFADGDSNLPIPEHTIKNIGDKELKVSIKMPLVSCFADIDVDISNDSIIVLAGSVYQKLTIILPKCIVKDSARAKFGKKNHVLTIEASILK